MDKEKEVIVRLADTDDESVANHVYGLLGREEAQLLEDGRERLWLYDRQEDRACGRREPGARYKGRFVVLALVEEGSEEAATIRGYARGVQSLWRVLKVGRQFGAGRLPPLRSPERRPRRRPAGRRDVASR